MGRREVIASYKQGGIKAVLDASGPALTWMRKRDRNAMQAQALQYAGNFWLEKYLPLRFTNYAYRLGYRVSEDWKKRKRRELKSDARPFIGLTKRGGSTFESDVGRNLFVTNGEKMAVAIVRTAKSRATRTSNNFRILLTMAYGHPILPYEADAFKTTPSSELKALALETARRMGLFLQGAGRPAIGARIPAIPAPPGKDRRASTRHKPRKH